MRRSRVNARINLRLGLEQLEQRQLLAGLVHETDLAYLGAFKLPSGTFGASSFGYGGTALAFNPANNSLFIVGHDWHQAIAEISIPTLSTSSSLSNLSTAGVLQPFVNVTSRVPNYTLEDTVKVGGLQVANGQLIVSLYEYYDGDADAQNSHYKLSSLNLSSASVTGLFKVGNNGGGYVGGYMAEVPDDWQDDFGAPYMTGLSGVAVIARTSAGPGAFGFDPAQLGGTTAPTTSLVYYPYWHGGSHPDDHPLADVDSTNPFYNTSTQIRGLVFPEGSESVLFFGSHGIGTWWYGSNGDYPGLNDPARTSKGEHAYPYVYQVWAYDANDLRDVKNGIKEPWEVQPYDVWNYEPPFAASSGHAGGVAYDPTTGRIFVAQPYGDGERPVIYVYQVGAPNPDREPPTITELSVQSTTSGGATIIWTTNEAADGQVEFGLTSSYGSTTSLNTSKSTSHAVEITGLSPERTYHFRVRSRDAAGNLAVSADGTFTTDPAGPATFSYNNPPSLPAPNPQLTVSVSNLSELLSALADLQSGQTIMIAPGTYDLASVTDALYVPQGVTDWAIRGATGNRDDVVIRGAGMAGSVRFGIWIGDSPHGTVADLTIDGVRQHGIVANYGADDLLVHNVRIVDSGDQFVKSNPNGAATDGNDRGIVEYSVFEYRTTDTDNYTNGVDVHAGDSWIVRYNLFKNILSPNGQGIAGPAVLMWNRSSNSRIEGNTFINVARGISLGLIDQAGGNDHSGGVIANNFFYRDPTLPQSVDVAIFVADSPNTKVLHNTIISRGSYPNAIEYRFASTTGLQIANNLTDGAIQARDGATATVTGNNTSANLSWFVNATVGDLHLVSNAPVIGQANTLTDANIDIDGQSRGATADLGADEYVLQPVVDTTPPMVSGIGATGVGSTTATIVWTSDEVADSQVDFGTTTSYGHQSPLFSSLVASHSVSLTNLTPSSLYHFRVRSRDAAGNLTVSGDVTFATSAATSGLVSAFGFDEGSGSVVRDQSGRTGSINGATWAAGVSGGGLSFNGVNDYVTVADASPLDLTDAMSLAAWVNPSNIGGWQTAILKEAAPGLAYALYASDNNNRPAVYINTGGSDIEATAAGPLTENAWTHLAATYASGMLKLYVNGQLAASRQHAGSIITSAGALQFGGNNVWGEYFEGRLDNVAVYNVALSASEIAALANTMNSAPVAIADEYTVNEDGTLAVAHANGVLANDSDVDENPLAAVLDAPTTHGALTLYADGSFTYRPTADFFGSDTFEYHANDGQASSATITVTITVEPVNDPPEIAPLPDLELSAQSLPILLAISDLESADSELTITASSSNPSLLPASGLLLDGSGSQRTLTVVPAPHQMGVATVSVTVHDPEGLAATQTFTVRVIAPIGCGGVLGDTNGDGLVGLTDLNNVRNGIGQVGNGLMEDVDCNGVVDLIDLNIVRNQFGLEPQASASRLSVSTDEEVFWRIENTLDLNWGYTAVFYPIRQAAIDAVFSQWAQAVDQRRRARSLCASWGNPST